MHLGGVIGGMTISFWSQATLIDHEASLETGNVLYFFLFSVYNVGLNRF